MFLPGCGPIAIADWSIIVHAIYWSNMCFSVVGAVVEMGILSTLKRLPMESNLGCVLAQTEELQLKFQKLSRRRSHYEYSRHRAVREIDHLPSFKIRHHGVLMKGKSHVPLT
jgi:hypothetical protein